MNAFVELISSDSKACHYAATACVYMGRAAWLAANSSLNALPKGSTI